MFDVITIGSAIQDTFLFLDPSDAPVINNPENDPTREKLIALEFGAKIDVEKSAITAGGGAANSAVTFARFGLKCAAVASLGDDDEGDNLEKVMKKEGINRKFIKRNKGAQTAFSVIIVAGKEKHDRVILIERGASDKLDFSSNSRGITDAQWYYLTAFSGKDWKKELSDITSASKEHVIKLAWNPGSAQIEAGAASLQKFMSNCEVFIVNKDEAIELVGTKKDIKSLGAELLSFGATRAIISDGINGAYYFDSTRVLHAKANKSLKAKEPTGAGDAFGSGFVASLVKNEDDVKAALDFGIRNSESVIQKTGAQEGIIYV